MKRNIGKNDRILRGVAGCALILGGLALSGTGGMVLAGFGLIPLATGLAGNCPAYSIFRIDTCKPRNF